MRLTVLGKSPSWQDAGGACSGYLIEEGDTAVLIDCGNGVFGKLRERIDYVDVDAVVISHLHADHFLDLVPYSYALTYAPRQQPVPVPTAGPAPTTPRGPRLIVPPGAREHFRRVVGRVGQRRPDRERLRPRGVRPVDDARGRAAAVRASSRCRTSPRRSRSSISSANGGGRLVYGADSSPTEALIEFARGADLLLIEATLPRPERTGDARPPDAAEAGEHARAAGRQARRAHPHLRRARPDRGRATQAAEALRRPGRVAREGAVYEV